jgi:succinate-acetate transporter protein
MRNYLRETIREEVRQGMREQARVDRTGTAPGYRQGSDGLNGRRPGRDGQDDGEGDYGHGDGRGGEQPSADDEAVFRVMLRPIATSLPLGFFAFTVGTVLLTALELSWVPAAATSQVAILVLAFVVPVEAVSGLFAFLARDSGAATGLTTLSAGWAAAAISLLRGSPGALSRTLAIFLLTLAVVILVMAAASVTGKPLFGLLLAIGACRFALTGVYQATGSIPVEQAAGWLGAPLALFALYGGLALLLEESHQRMVLPLGRRGRARTSLEGGFGHQVQQAEQEPGVRRQL